MYYVHQLPDAIKNELCIMLDFDNSWRELLSIYTKSRFYGQGIFKNIKFFDVKDIEEEVRRLLTSPTSLLLARLGRLLHRVSVLFMLLYRMKHVPALRCLVPVADPRCQPFLREYDKKDVIIEMKIKSLGDSVSKLKSPKADGAAGPLPAMLMDKGVQLPTSSTATDVSLLTCDSSTLDSRNLTLTQDHKGNDNDMDDEFLRKVSTIPLLSYEELRLATDNWNERNLLGRGGFAQVYKGEWKLLPVAVKRLRDNDGKNKELIREMCLNQYRHDNILPLYGYSLGGPQVCLVYQLMAGGSLEQRLTCKTHHSPLSWYQRYRIAHGVARGLQYLHTMAGTPLIHGDIKPANILLDQYAVPKIGDFGLARKGRPYGVDRTHLKVSRIHGTPPYLPEEYLQSRCLSPAVDVFSFGVVLLEIVTALPPTDTTRSALLLSDYMHQLTKDGVDFASLEDPVLRNTEHSNSQLCREFGSIGIHCTQYKRHERPTMLEVYKRLDAIDLPGKQYV